MWYCVHLSCTTIPIIIEDQFQVFQRFSSSKLVLQTVESCFVALTYYGNGSRSLHQVGRATVFSCILVYVYIHSECDRNACPSFSERERECVCIYMHMCMNVVSAIEIHASFSEIASFVF